MLYFSLNVYLMQGFKGDQTVGEDNVFEDASLFDNLDG